MTDNKPIDQIDDFNDQFLAAMQNSQTRTVTQVIENRSQSSISFRAGTGNEVKMYFDNPGHLLEQLRAMTLLHEGTMQECVEKVREVLREKKE